jgi:hypothetical protein
MDWKVLAVIAVAVIVGGGAYLVWRSKTKPVN